MRLILGVLGHKILEPSIKRKSDEKENLYILQDRTGIKASGKPISEGFAVLKGSKIADNVATSLSKSVINKRQLRENALMTWWTVSRSMGFSFRQSLKRI